jgi:hypothetical protein
LAAFTRARSLRKRKGSHRKIDASLFSVPKTNSSHWSEEFSGGGENRCLPRHAIHLHCCCGARCLPLLLSCGSGRERSNSAKVQDSCGSVWNRSAKVLSTTAVETSSHDCCSLEHCSAARHNRDYCCWTRIRQAGPNLPTPDGRNEPVPTAQNCWDSRSLRERGRDPWNYLELPRCAQSYCRWPRAGSC